MYPISYSPLVYSWNCMLSKNSKITILCTDFCFLFICFAFDFNVRALWYITQGTFLTNKKKNGLQQNTDILVAFHAYATL